MSESLLETSTESAISAAIASTPTSTTKPTTSTSSTSPTIEPTITPFVQPPSCANLFTTITTSGLIYGNITAATLPLVLSNTADPLFSACQQPGWDRGGAGKHRRSFWFSPAVCPSAWTAYDVLADSKSKTSSAYCCSPGYTHGWPPIQSMSRVPGYNSRDFACYRVLADSEDNKTLAAQAEEEGPGDVVMVVDSTTTITTVTSTLNSIQMFTAGVQMHQPYQIAWQSSDVPFMSPRPPPRVCSGDAIPSWAPGDENSGFYYCNEPQNDLKGLEGVMWFVMVGLPLIAIAAMGCCVWCCCASRRHRRLDKEEARVRREDREVVRAI
ncbi:hypothetical protein QBC42DRAFT_332384 [Cladorrhinum samala]|uniref:CUB domain-containing protein n=1 Tax=Cladorrhinum samala TaxID=585594 RepID=A0AAV9HN37_9PEZI|nr:hypothetical protein QBC42DRAFT_332384 [Cladorrhinum samala]